MCNQTQPVYTKSRITWCPTDAGITGCASRKLRFGALRTIGAIAWLLGELRAGEGDRTEAIAQAYGTFAEVMGFETWQDKAVTRERTVETVVEKLRKVLGIGELTHLRTELIERASQSLK